MAELLPIGTRVLMHDTVNGVFQGKLGTIIEHVKSLADTGNMFYKIKPDDPKLPRPTFYTWRVRPLFSVATRYIS